jgi:hypothetical protein
MINRYVMMMLVFLYCADVSAMKPVVLPVALIPTQRLSLLGLCPLYPRYEEFSIEGETIKNMLPVKFKRLGSWDLQLVDKESALKLMPCIKQGKELVRDQLVQKLTAHNMITNRIFMQLKTVNQNEAPEGTAMCAGLSLRTSALMYDYARTGDVKFLSQLPDLSLAQKFLDTYGCVRWVDPELLPSWIGKVGVDASKFSVIPTVFMLDSRYHAEPIIAYSFDEAKLKEMAQLRRMISEGLKADKFFHTFIIGDYEVAQKSGGRGHYFSFSIFKVGTTVEYVVADTQVENYHLRQGSYEYTRLLYLIDLLETGENSYSSSQPLLDLYKDTPIKKD